ncbi:efflux RND transporter periplasmic adaptor subunit [Candidatus Daviesbacteria bacterium]|nr:efflux RND transporter periplasmic adaptor subunit [Candidatus Daviesbacteria bacterium]
MSISNLLKSGKKRVIIPVAIIILVIFGFNFFAPKKRLPLQFTQVIRRDIKEIVASSGTLTGKDVVNLKFKSSGRIAYINVKAGDRVFAYQTIAGLDTKLLSIDLQQAQNTLRDKQASAEKVEDDVKDHSKDETYTQRSTRTTAQVARDNAVDAVKEAQQALLDANIYTPIAGIVTQAPITFGQYVSSSDLIAQVADISSIYFETDVLEADISKISLGLKAEITLDAFGEKVFTGVVDQIIPQAKTTSSGATVVPVKVKLDPTKMTFINGLSGQASVIVKTSQNVLTLPREAVRDDNTVFIQKNGSVSPAKVVPGIYSDTEVEIKEGLEDKEKVLLNPPANDTGTRNRSPLQGIFRFFGGSRGR